MDFKTDATDYVGGAAEVSPYSAQSISFFTDFRFSDPKYGRV